MRALLTHPRGLAWRSSRSHLLSANITCFLSLKLYSFNHLYFFTKNQLCKGKTPKCQIPKIFYFVDSEARQSILELFNSDRERPVSSSREAASADHPIPSRASTERSLEQCPALSPLTISRL